MTDDDLVGAAVRNGLLLAASRTYGEQYIEPFVRYWYGFRESRSADHDAVDDRGTRYEIKACKVLHSSVNRRGTRSLLERIHFETDNLVTHRAVPFSEAFTAQYDANVQNVKRDHFDELVYVLLFADCVKVFFASREDIVLGSFRGWSDKHGRYDALGKSGQFSVNRQTIGWHLDRHLRETVGYGAMAEAYAQIRGDL